VIGTSDTGFTEAHRPFGPDGKGGITGLRTAMTWAMLGAENTQFHDSKAFIFSA
jgi:hypothetical protein